jgi:hypothetical protein
MHVDRRFFAALLALPAAFASQSLLFLMGPLWNQDQRLVSSMGSVSLLLTLFLLQRSDHPLRKKEKSNDEQFC